MNNSRLLRAAFSLGTDMGTVWRRSGATEFDDNGDRALGAIVNFFVGGTTTPLAVYADAAESEPHEVDIEASGTGKWPTIFIPFIPSYRERAQTAGGVLLWDIDNIPNPDPVEASEDSVDETQLLQTGMVIWEPVAGLRNGFVRINGRTIGSAASGASERANADCEDLFLYLWNNLADAQAVVSAGRGASAAADWAANKTIALPDARRGALFGLFDMGNSAAGNDLRPYTNGNRTTPGSACGENSHTMTSAELVAHTHAVGTLATISDGAHVHTYSGTTTSETHTHSGTTDAGSAHGHAGSTVPRQGFAQTGAEVSGTLSSGSNNGGLTTQAATIAMESAHTHPFSISGGAHTHGYSGSVDSSGAHTHTLSGATASTGSTTAFNVVQYGILGTFFMKL